MKLISVTCRCCIPALAFLFPAFSGMAQGLVTFNTDSTTPLISQMQTLDTTVPGGQPLLEFDFGFASAESPSPGAFLDSFTVSLQDLNQTSTAILFTEDPSGLVLAPASPGTLVLNPALMNLNAIAYPSLQPVVPNPTAFHLSMPVPQEFVGNPVNVFFDLFNNQDALASQAWVDNVQISTIPEPPVSMLLLLSGCILWKFSRRKIRP